MMSFEKKVAQACSWVYSDEPDFVCGDTEVKVYFIDKKVCFVFRGTQFDYKNILKDILSDVRAFPWYVSELGCWCHSGMVKGVRGWWGNGGVFPQILEYIENYHLEDKEIVFAGHSKGGGEATFAAALCNLQGIKCRLITLGSPKVATKGILKALEGVDSLRYVRGADVVTTVPRGPWWQEIPVVVYQYVDKTHKFEDHQVLRYIKGM